ncbi:MAG: hypothetical protein DLM62_18695 [Pseudonocardiales bacterium]|nr:MAG: hypothetical protein DLM62_18695 [Pseudonocardiales bacterium]
MDLTFSSAALAAVCNSERRLTQRWGLEVGRAVARRLLDLAATDAAALDRLPGARVSINGTGETAVTFGEAIVIRGVISISTDGTCAPRSDADHMVITSLDVHGSDQR